MAEINLLSNETKQTKLRFLQTKIWVLVLAGLLLALTLYYIFLLFQGRTLAQRIEKQTAELSRAQQKGLAGDTRNTVVTRQQQLAAVNTLLTNHFYWSRFLPELAAVTVRPVQYASINAQTDGSVEVVVTAPTPGDLDRYLQALDASSINKYFTNITMNQLSNTQESGKVEYQMKIGMQFDKKLLANPAQISTTTSNTTGASGSSAAPQFGLTPSTPNTQFRGGPTQSNP